MHYSRLSMPLMATMAILFSGPAFGQAAVDAYPTRPVALILSTAAGGPNDFEVRLYSSKISAMLGQPFVLDFKAGAGGTLGNAYVAKAKPDGYTLLVASANFTVSAVLYKDLGFDKNEPAPPAVVVPKAEPAK